MSRSGRKTLLLLIVGLLITGFSLTVLAAEESEEGGSEDATTTTIDSGLAPAVEVSPPDVEPVAVDWTYRYIIPTGLALVGIIVLFTAIKYFTDVVRRRYRVIEE